MQQIIDKAFLSIGVGTIIVQIAGNYGKLGAGLCLKELVPLLPISLPI